MSVRVAVIGARLTGPQTGVARYIRSMLAAWRRSRPPEIDSVVVHGPVGVELGDGPASPWIHVRTDRSRLPPLVWENFVLPSALDDADVLLAPSFTMPLARRVPPTVLVVYDALQAVRSADFSLRGRLVLPLYRASVGRATQIVTVSEAARDDIASAFHVDADSLHVLPGGVDGHFRPEPDEDAGEVRARLRIGPEPFLLFVGKLSTRRNIPAVITAAGLLAARGTTHHLVLVGYNSRDLQLDELASAAKAQVIHLEGVSDSDLATLYRAADVFVQAPMHETYSLPLLEAMACGTPAVTSAQPGLREIGGDAVVYARGTDALSIADAVAGVLGDPAERARLSAAGPIRAALFTWDAQAAKLADLVIRTAKTA